MSTQDPRTRVTGYLRVLQAKLAGRTNESLEAVIGPPLIELIESLARLSGKPGVSLRGEAQERDIGIPDFSVKDGLLLIGHVETKAPGEGADTSRFKKGHNREQWERFKRLPNVLYADGISFGLYRSGELAGRLLTLDFEHDDPDQEAKQGETAELVALLTEFLAWKAVSPRSLAELAERLAPLCAVLRDAVRVRLDEHGSQVKWAAEEFENALFPGRTPDEIADAFAQVCAYSMLLARDAGASELTAHGIEETLHHQHPVLGRVVAILLDDKTEEELGWALGPVRSLVHAVDFEALRAARPLPSMTAYDQTWLYFYEAFLAQYDPKLRDQYGVYYTPQQVIGAQVTLLDDLLRSRLGKHLGFASPGVTVLDPAVGTGSYPIKVVQQAAETAASKLGEKAVPEVIGSLADRLYAFELLVGPYAVAHLRLAETIADYGARVPGEAVNVYLTDTLDSPYMEPGRITRILEPLVEEQRKVIQVKSERTQVLVCLGNPPYERGRRITKKGGESGGWVAHGEGKGGKTPIFENFLEPARKAGLGGHLKNLYNEYVYFWRWVIWKVFETGDDGSFSDKPGLLSLITASSYLGGPGFVGMREWMRRACDEILIIDLGGEGRGTRRDENVFAIQTPVAIAILIRDGKADPDVPATVRYARISGTREKKLQALDGIKSVSDLAWEACPEGWGDAFLPTGGTDWMSLPLLVDIFPWSHSGAQVKRTWPISPKQKTLEERWKALLSMSGETSRAAAFKETRDRKITSHPAPLFPDSSQSVLAELTRDEPPPPIVRYGYRPWDRQWLIADARLADYLRPELWHSLNEQQVFITSLLTKPMGEGPAVLVTALIPDLDHFSGRGAKDVVPLFKSSSGEPNVASGVLNVLAERLGREVSMEDLFSYAYAILFSSRYVERFFTELQVPGPRLPITANPELFERAVERGHRLIWLHTFGERMTGEGRPRGTIPDGSAKLIESVGDRSEDMPTEFAYDPAAREIRIGEKGRVGPVPPEVWEFSVSGWHVVRQWLRYRMRDGAGRARSSASPLDRIRPATWPAEYTIELLELLAVLEHTVAQQPSQAKLLDAICDGELITVDELPKPTSTERRPPKAVDSDQSGQSAMDI